MTTTETLMILALTLPLPATLALLHVGFRAPRRPVTRTPEAFGMNYRQVSIPTQHDKTLSAWLLTPPGEMPTATVVIVHGWGANAELMLPLAKPFYQQGWQVLLLDARNHGASDGDGHSSMPKFAEDAESAIDWLKSCDDGTANQVALVGHSVGAAATLLAASRRTDLTAAISIASFAHPAELMRRRFQQIHLPETLISLLLAYVQHVIGHRFEDIAPINTLRKIECPVLLVHGTSDTVIPVSDLETLRRANPRKNVDILLINGAGHDSVDHLQRRAGDLVRFLDKAGLGEVVAYNN